MMALALPPPSGEPRRNQDAPYCWFQPAEPSQTKHTTAWRLYRESLDPDVRHAVDSGRFDSDWIDDIAWWEWPHYFGFRLLLVYRVRKAMRRLRELDRT